MMKAALKITKDYRDTGQHAIRIVLQPESTADKAVANAVMSGQSPEGNVVGWLDGVKIVLEAEA